MYFVFCDSYVSLDYVCSLFKLWCTCHPIFLKEVAQNWREKFFLTQLSLLFLWLFVDSFIMIIYVLSLWWLLFYKLFHISSAISLSLLNWIDSCIRISVGWRLWVNFRFVWLWLLIRLCQIIIFGGLYVFIFKVFVVKDWRLRIVLVIIYN